MRLAWARDSISDALWLQRRLAIGSREVVLDVGSGGTPHPRANVLCDRFLTDSDERHGQPLIADRPLVVADVQDLPFADKSFDVVICRHVLEHVDDPARAAAELSRVGRRGYVECPAAEWEKLAGFEFHRWLVSRRGSALVFRAKAGPIYDPQLREWFMQLQRVTGIAERIWFARRQVGIYASLVWRDRLDVSVEGRPGEGGEGSPEQARSGPSSFSDLSPGLDLVGRTLGAVGRVRRRRSDLTWAELAERLVCPRCSESYVYRSSYLECRSCARRVGVEGSGLVRFVAAGERFETGQA